jgi:hypothetical protein
MRGAPYIVVMVAYLAVVGAGVYTAWMLGEIRNEDHTVITGSLSERAKI